MKQNIHTRRNLSPNSTTLVEDLENILKRRKKKIEKGTSSLQISLSLPIKGVKTIDDIKFDLKFEHSLF